MMMMKSVFWWRKPEYPEETTDLRQVTDETFHTVQRLPSPGIELGLQLLYIGNMLIVYIVDMLILKKYK